MRFMLIVHMTTETANSAVREGRVGALLQRTMEQLQPEAAYFGPLEGMRTAFMVINLDDVSRIPAISEPFYQELGARLDFVPVMTADDLAKGLAAIAQAGAPSGT